MGGSSRLHWAVVHLERRTGDGGVFVGSRPPTDRHGNT